MFRQICKYFSVYVDTVKSMMTIIMMFSDSLYLLCAPFSTSLVNVDNKNDSNHNIWIQNPNIIHPYTIGMLYSTSRTSVKPSLFVYSVAGDV